MKNALALADLNIEPMAGAMMSFDLDQAQLVAGETYTVTPKAAATALKIKTPSGAKLNMSFAPKGPTKM